MNYFKICVFIIFISIIGCGIDSENNFPETNVYLEIPITMPLYNNIYGNLWGYEYLAGGIGGIILVQGMDEFIAYDKSCTFEMNSECVVSGQSINDPILFCNCCNSQFVIIDGSVSEGPANQALKRYNTYFDGTMLYITN
jgi:Rieske Fe-S protein